MLYGEGVNGVTAGDNIDGLKRKKAVEVLSGIAHT
jgi:hypothetical protein